MGKITVHVERNDSAVIFCNSCGDIKKVSVRKFRNVKHNIAARCVCGKRLDINLNFRRYYRKVVSIPGKVLFPISAQWAPVTILDLSLYGLKIETTYAANLKDGDIVRVKFLLEGRKSVLIEKQARVVYGNNEVIGCEFVNIALEEKEIGFFLFQ